jgi:hypothetical protein
VHRRTVSNAGPTDGSVLGLAQLRQQQRQRAIDDDGDVTVGNPMS